MLACLKFHSNPYFSLDLGLERLTDITITRDTMHECLSVYSLSFFFLNYNVYFFSNYLIF